MRYKLGDLIKYHGVRVTINHIVNLRGRQRVYFSFPVYGNWVQRNAWGTDVVALNTPGVRL